MNCINSFDVNDNIDLSHSVLKSLFETMIFLNPLETGGCTLPPIDPSI